MPYYIPRSQRGRKKRDYLRSFTASTNLEKQDRANQRKILELIESGELEEFIKHKEGKSLWDRVKTLGSGALDVLQRGEYAAAGGLEEVWGGEPGISGREAGAAIGRAGRELFSGVGGIQGQKKTFGDVIKKNVPEYKRWAKEHPVLSTGTDLALSIGLDPTTYVGLGLIDDVARLTGKGFAKTVGKTKIAKGAGEVLGRAFDPAYLWKKAKAAKGYDILWSEGKFAKGLSRKYHKELDPAIDAIATWEPEKVKNFVRVMYGDIPLSSVSDDVKDTALNLKSQLKKIGRRESKYLGKGTDWMLDNYLPNNPKQLTEFMEEAGEHVTRGYGQGLADFKKSFEHSKKLITGEIFLDWAKNVGISDENLGEVVVKNLTGRVGQSISRVRQIRIQHKLIRDLPEIFRKLPYGTKHVFDTRNIGTEEIPKWITLVKPGDSIWMPAGNLRFFKQEIMAKKGNIAKVWKKAGKFDPEDIEQLTEIKELNKALAAKIENAISGGLDLVLTADELQAIQKTLVGVTTKVTAYAVPKEIVEDITKVSKRLASETDILKWWDDTLNIWKNTAILSPFFHMRNFISSSSQNYLADINPARFKDGFRVLLPTTPDGAKILGRTKKAWNELFNRYGITGGSFVGQQTGKTGIPVVEKVFKFNRWIGGHIEEHQRASLFMDGIKKGMKPLEAAKRVKKFHFDYYELTDFERKVAKRFFPFWSWTRKNIPLQLEMIVKAPKKYKYLAQLKRAVIGGPENEYNPDWWKEQDVWETKGDKAWHVGLPYTDLNMLQGSPVGMLGPAATIYNIAANYDPFYKEKISRYKGQKVPVVTIGDKTYGLNPTLKYAIEGFIPVAQRYGFDLIKQMQNFLGENDEQKLKAKYKIINKFIGIKLIPQLKSERERARVYRLRDALRDYALYKKQGVE